MFIEISIWHAPTGNELLRISQANKTCNSICFTRDGKMIIRYRLRLI
jgi:hypothetical protein